ncbi:right-handed parallel beta-helix repeat-containing protein [Micromonospora sp. NPDC050397]|uniref:right-handed parallel beta-helix repeat-containing protein n=1 Tax=Micromonospora sp. NPDC050397 TaxID=3364279 RepID=UPI00384E6BD2
MAPTRSTLLRRSLVIPAAGLAALLTALVGITATASAAALFADDFEDGNSNGWSRSGGSWTVVTDGSRALRQGNVGAELSRVFAGSVNWTSYRAQVRVKPSSHGTPGGFVAVAARSTGATSFDRLALFVDRAELHAVRGGAVTVLGSAPVAVPVGTWATLAVEVSGGTVRGLVDGRVVGQGTSQAGNGRVGLQTYRATASFDDVDVQSGAPDPTPTATASPTPTGPPPSGGSLVVATNGDDSAPGSLERPLRTIQRAVDLAQPGDTIAVRGGTYAPTGNIRITRSGTATAPITLTGYGTERVLIDGEQMPHTPAPLDGSIPNAERGAIHMAASYWRLVGLEIANGPYGVYCRTCHNNVFDRLVTRDNYESGLQIQGEASNNLVLNLDSHGNRDPRKNGESADGLAIKEGSGTGNVVRGARLWNNVDDGFDAWEFLSPILIEDSVAWGNGVDRWGFPNFAGDGNGFKLGGGDEDLPAGHLVRNSIAFDNAQGGFIDNANPGAMRLDRNTAWRNGGTGFDVADSLSTLTGNLAVGNGQAVSLGGSTGTGNSWDLGGTWTDAALVSTDRTAITGPRTAAGGIPSSPFLRPLGGIEVGARI